MDQAQIDTIKNLGRTVASMLQVAKDAGRLLYFVPDPVGFPTERHIVNSVAADQVICYDAPREAKAILVRIYPKDFYHFADGSHWQISEEPVTHGLLLGVDPEQFQLKLKGIG